MDCYLDHQGGASLQVLARTERCQNHAFRVAGRAMWSVPFHAEMGPEETRGLAIAKAESHRIPGNFLGQFSVIRPSPDRAVTSSASVRHRPWRRHGKCRHGR